MEVAKFLQILTGMEKTETRRIVASLPCVLYEELDGEACSYIEEALDFYTAKYKFEPVGDEKEVYEEDPSVYPSKHSQIAKILPQVHCLFFCQTIFY